MAYLKLRKTIDLHAPGVVFHHVTFATEALPTMARFLPQGVHVVLGPFGSAVSAGPAPLTKRVARWSRGAIARWNLGRADVAIAQNDDVYAAIRTRARAKLYLEPNAVVDLTPSPEDREVPCVDLSGVCHDPRTVRPIVVAGRLIPRKRVDLAIAAMALLRGNGTQMWIIGDGPELGALRAQVEALRLEDQVHFFGEIPRAHLLDVLRMASVLVHLSSQEGAGWVVAEAQSAGAVPVVVKGSGADTVVRLGGFGEVVSEAKPALVAASIECAAASHPAPTSRWSSDRIVDLLPIWYSGAWKDPKGEHA
ncbi:glycosyltransferase [Rhodococcus ruber]|uniref:glycosyltransferase n=1 Tax=Rhodococcus ruber TaxID=1830 RepID=UPI0015587653|nr:glycosyltransferase [Rhodococcus ruber]